MRKKMRASRSRIREKGVGGAILKTQILAANVLKQGINICIKKEEMFPFL
jgi:hypothetical protein